jgi:hypothetical protein
MHPSNVHPQVALIDIASTSKSKTFELLNQLRIKDNPERFAIINQLHHLDRFVVNIFPRLVSSKCIHCLALCAIYVMLVMQRVNDLLQKLKKNDRWKHLKTQKKLERLSLFSSVVGLDNFCYQLHVIISRKAFINSCDSKRSFNSCCSHIE